MRNDGTGHNWLKLRLTGIVSNRAAIGARIVAQSGDHQQMRIVGAGCGFQSQNSLEVEFGFGTSETVDVLQIYWPSGVITTLEDVATNQTLPIVESVESPVFVVVDPLGQVFSRGDTLLYRASVTNTTGELQVFDAWTEVTTPWGMSISPMLGPVLVYLSPFHTISTILGQIIPGNAPFGGYYTYTLKAGLCPDETWSEDSFEFSIVP